MSVEASTSRENVAVTFGDACETAFAAFAGVVAVTVSGVGATVVKVQENGASDEPSDPLIVPASEAVYVVEPVSVAVGVNVAL